MFKTALVVSLTVAFADALLCFPHSHHPFALDLLMPLAATFAWVFLTFLLLYITIGQILIRILKLQADAFAFSLSFALGSGFLLFSLRLSISGSLGLNWFQLFAPCALIFLGAIAAYFACQNFQQSSVRFRAVTALLAGLPFLLAEIFVFRLLNKEKFLAPPLLVSLAVIAILLTLWILFRLRETRWPARALYSLATMAVVGFALFVIVEKSEQPLTRSVQRTNHKIRNVLLITIDTLRADVISAYNNNAPQTPNLDRLAQDGLLFENGFSEAPWTLPAVASIMTGVSPFVHSATAIDSQIPAELTTLPEFMQRAGYQTGAIGRNINLVKKLPRGFGTYQFFPKPRIEGLGGFLLKILLSKSGNTDANTADLTRLTERWIDQNSKQDFFFWLHYFDPHMPYNPPGPYQPQKGYAKRIGRKFHNSFKPQIRTGFFVPDKSERQWIKDLYLGEVRYVDDQLGKLMNHLKKKGLYDQTLIFVTSDHGEEFGEHEGFFHGHSLYNELLRVPLIVKMPGSVFKGRRVPNVTTTAILPTILELCEIPFTPELFSSPSFASLLASDGLAKEQPVVSTGLLFYSDKVSIQDREMKYLRDLTTSGEQIYDMVKDPGEQHSLPLNSDSVAEGRRLLEENLNFAVQLQAKHRITGPQREDLDQETEEMLRSLGYIQ